MTTAEQDTPIDVEQIEQAVEAATPVFKFQDLTTLPDGRLVMVRLPNQFQHEDVSLKASAAQARRMRQLRDPESDSYIVLESDLDDLVRGEDRGGLVEELVGGEWWKDHLEAIKDVQEREEFATIEEDMGRLDALIDRPDDQRPEEEFEELRRHVERYNDAVEAAREQRTEPRRRALDDRDTADLISEVREKRIAAEGRRARERAFTLHELAVGTYAVNDDKQPTHLYFQSVDAVESADPETLHILTSAFATLEAQFNRGAVGNG